MTILKLDSLSDNTSDINIDLKSTFPLLTDWSLITINLDPFVSAGDIYFIINSLPSESQGLKLVKIKSSDNSITHIDFSNTIADKIKVVTISTEKNQIYGISDLGNVYTWSFNPDFSVPMVDPTVPILISGCTNPQMAELYSGNSQNILIVTCLVSSYTVINTLDISNNNSLSTIVLDSTKSTTVSVLKAYSTQNILIIGESTYGYTYIFNYVTNKFIIIHQLSSGKIKDKPQFVELLSDLTTLWVQYQYSNMLYPLQNCLEENVGNSKDCYQCPTKVYIKEDTTDPIDEGYLGQGTSIIPYKRGANLITSIQKMKYYKSIQTKMIDMALEINLDSTSPTNIPTNYLDFDQSESTTLKLVSSTAAPYAKLNYKSVLKFSPFKSITISYVSFEFLLNTDYPDCGIIFNNSPTISITDIQFNFAATSTITTNQCDYITANSQTPATLDIKTFKIENKDFTNHKSIITSNGYSISIDDLKLTGSTLGDNFSVVLEQSGQSLKLQNSFIQNNVCVTNWIGSSVTSTLFTSSQFTVGPLQITNNSFCNTEIFTTAAFANSNTLLYELKNIDVIGNTFASIQQNIFFNAQFTMLPKPQNSITLDTITFDNNSMLEISKIKLASFVSLYEIDTVTANNINFKNHNSIQFADMNFINTLTMTSFYCTYDSLPANPVTVNAGCLSLYEITAGTFSIIRIFNKKLYDQSLITIQNNQIKDSTISFTDAQFTNLQLNQASSNTFANAIQVKSINKITLTLDNLTFDANKIFVIAYPNTYSANLWIESYQSDVIIKNSFFKNSYSNSQYNYVYCLSNSLALDNVQFSASSFTEVLLPSGIKGELFTQNGGMINAKVQQLTITNSGFSQSTAFKGSFMYVKSIGDNLKVEITSTTFSEGYGLLDGGAFYFDSLGKKFDFTCTTCTFNNIYTLYKGAAIISFEQYGNTSLGSRNTKIIIDGGKIKNMYGVQDNSFIETYQASIQIKNIPDIDSQIFTSNSAPHAKYLTMTSQQTTLLNLIDSDATLFNCGIQNYKISNSDSVYSLYIMAENSQITLDTVKISNGQFVLNAFSVKKKSTLTFTNTQVSNIKQYVAPARLLQLLDEELPNKFAYSLILVDTSSFALNSNSLISQVTCNNNCNGVVQIINGSFNADTSKIELGQTTFGGAIFISGFTGINTWKALTLDQSKSYYDGGSVFFSAGTKDIFKLTLDSCFLTNNQAVNGKGGAMYITSEIQNSPNQSIIILDSTVSKNQAKVGGGIDNTNISPLVKGNSVFSGNIGEFFGNDQFSYPSHLKLVGYDTPNSLIVMNDFRSGGTLQNLVFEFMNEKNEKILPVSLIEIQSYDIYVRIDPNTENIKKYTIRGEDTTYYSMKTKQFDFKELVIVGTPGTSVDIQFRSDSIYVLDAGSNTYEKDYSFIIRLNFRSCQSGEEIRDYNGMRECAICDEGNYSYHIQACKACPDGATCAGGDKVVANAGYWRKNFDSELVEKCYNLPENCIGGVSGNSVCFEGHIGALCEECDIYAEYWPNNYSKSGKYACTRCDKIKGNIWFVFIMTAWTMISMTLAIKGDIEMLKEKAAGLAIQKQLKRKSTVTENEQSIQNSKKKKGPKKQEDQSSIFIKMLTNYLQIVGCVASFNIAIPNGIFDVPNSVGSPLKESLNSLDCALLEIGTEIPMVYLRLIFSLFVPIIYFILFMLGTVIVFYVKKEKEFPWFIISTSTMFLIIFVQPDLVSQTISLLSCRKVGESNYILSYVASECYTSEHIKYSLFLMIPLLILWVFVLPGLLLQLLRRNKDKLDTLQIKLKFGFLYKEYLNHAYYWEFIKMFEKLTIILALNFYSQNIPTKGVIIFFIISTYGITSYLVGPYKEYDVNQVDVQSTNVCAITVLLALFMYDNPYPYLVILALIVVVIINLIFIVNIVSKILMGYLIKFSEPIEKLCEKIPFLRKIFKITKQKKFKPETKKKLREIFQKYLDMDEEQRKQLYLSVFEKQIDIQNKDKKQKASKQNTKIEDKAQSSHSPIDSNRKVKAQCKLILDEENEQWNAPTENGDEIPNPIKIIETKNMQSIANLLNKKYTASTPSNQSNDSPNNQIDQDNFNEKEGLNQITLYKN